MESPCKGFGRRPITFFDPDEISHFCWEKVSQLDLAILSILSTYQLDLSYFGKEKTFYFGLDESIEFQ